MQPSKKFALRLLPTLFCIMSLLLVACGSTSNGGGNSGTSTQSAKASEDKQIFVRPYQLADLATLDPPQTTDLYSSQAMAMVYTGLVELDDKGQILDVLAANHSVSTDGLTWTFTLRDNAKFNDGNPVTSDDVVYSIDRALQPDQKSPYASYYMGLLKDVDKLEAGKVKTLIGDSLLNPDPKTVKILINKKAAYFLYALSFTTNYILEKSFVEKYGSKYTDHLAEGGCSGPFIVSNYTRGKEIDFTPNPNYFGKKPQLKKVVRPFYKESDTAYRAYQVNQLDEAPVPTANIAQAKSLPNNQFHMNVILAISYYTMNYLVKPFDNIHIRQAFALALDKDVIANDIYKGTVIASNHIVPQGMPGYYPDLKGPGGVTDTKAHPDLAKQLLQQGLQEEGYASIADLPHITFTVSSLGEADLRNEYQADQQAWKNALGINVTMNDVDFNKLSSDITGTLNNKNLMAWGLGWIADYPDPQDFTSIQFARGGANNSMNYGQNSSADTAQQQATQDLLLKADAETDPVLRMKEYNQAEQQLVNDVAWMPTFQQTSPFVLKPCVANFNINVFDLVPPDDWANTYISTATPCADTSSYK